MKIIMIDFFAVESTMYTLDSQILIQDFQKFSHNARKDSRKENATSVKFIKTPLTAEF